MSSRSAELPGLAIEAPESRDADLEARNADLGLRNGERSAQAAALEERLKSWCRGTRATPRCRRHPMTCRAGRLPASGNAAGGAPRLCVTAAPAALMRSSSQSARPYPDVPRDERHRQRRDRSLPQARESARRISDHVRQSRSSRSIRCRADRRKGARLSNGPRVTHDRGGSWLLWRSDPPRSWNGPGLRPRFMITEDLASRDTGILRDPGTPAAGSGLDRLRDDQPARAPRGAGQGFRI
jgi:hypothetical protein